MRKSVFANVIFGSLSLMFLESVLLTFALAHEGAQMECSETNIIAMHADVQSMPDGEAKTTALAEMKMAEEAVANNDVKTCTTHMLNAMEATEE